MNNRVACRDLRDIDAYLAVLAFEICRLRCAVLARDVASINARPTFPERGQQHGQAKPSVEVL